MFSYNDFLDEKSSLKRLSAALKSGKVSVNDTDDEGRTMLMFAARANALKVMQLLIEHKADVNARNIDGAVPLMFAVSYEGIEQLIKAGADVKARCNEGTTVLMHSALLCVEKVSEVVELLLANGAEINETNERGETPLLLAVNGNAESDMVRALINAGADVTVKDHSGCSIFIYAIRGYGDRAYKLLKSAGVDLNKKDENGITAFVYAVVNSHDCGVIRSLIDEGADVNGADNSGITPLMFAAGHNRQYEIVRLLMEMGADVGARDKNGMTALMHAAARNTKIKVLDELCKHGCRLDDVDNNGYSVLAHAVTKNDLHIIGWLLENNADVYFKNADGQTLLMLAAEKGREPKILNKLIQAGIAVNAADKDKFTALHYAGQSGSAAAVTALIRAGAKVNALSSMRITPLMTAAECDNSKAVSALIKAGAWLNVKDSYGLTALMRAASNGTALAALRLLIRAGAKLDEQDAQGNTALIHAALCATDPAFITELIKAGARPDLVNCLGMTAMDEIQYNANLVNTKAPEALRKYAVHLQFRVMAKAFVALSRSKK